MEKKAKRELEKMRNPWQQLKETAEEIDELQRIAEYEQNKKTTVCTSGKSNPITKQDENGQE